MRPTSRPTRNPALNTLGIIIAIPVALISALASAISRLLHRGHRGTGYPSRNSLGRGRRSLGSMRYGTLGWSSGRTQPALRVPVVVRCALVGAGILTLLSTVLFVDGIGLATEAEASLLNIPAKTAAQIPASTPREEWEQGSLPYLYQTDPAWSSKPYAGGTVERNGCGPTCLAMIYIYLTGNTDMDAGDMCAFADEHNFAPTGATEHAFMTDGAALLGITGTAINPGSTSEIVSALRAGEPVVCVLRPGYFTTVGHFIILYGIDDSGMVNMHDPNSSYRSAQKWDLKFVLSQASVCWTFSL
ncbi:C39 family peptidase [Enorma sp.]|uniref:C39 family peptidase n=1 Tax=Enorma sp. TaxID=1920692 RepID=UPI003AB8E3CD